MKKAALLTHAHEDHAWRAASFADVPVWEEACPAGDSWEAGARLRVAAVPHDTCGGTRMGYTRALRLELDLPGAPPFAVVHAGDLGTSDSPELRALCRGADLLLLPAGGTYTLGPEEAVALAESSGAGAAVLMHLRELGIDLPMLTPDEAIARAGRPVTRVPTGALTLPLPASAPPLYYLAPTAPLLAPGAAP